MPSRFFLDTSAVQHLYVDGKASRRIRYLLGYQDAICHIADLTILEVASALANRCRQQATPVELYDKFDRLFFRDLASRLQVTYASTRHVDRARRLIRYSFFEKKRKLHSGDALIAVCCLELALDLREPVSFYLSDEKLFKTLREINAFRSAVNLRFVDQNTGSLTEAPVLRRSA